MKALKTRRFDELLGWWTHWLAGREPGRCGLEALHLRLLVARNLFYLAAQELYPLQLPVNISEVFSWVL